MSQPLSPEQRQLLDSVMARHGIPQRSPDRRPLEIPLDQDVSVRELEVLELLCDGLTNEQLALRLEISIETVKTHIRKLLQKLGAQNRAHAVAIAFRSGLIEL